MVACMVLVAALGSLCVASSTSFDSSLQAWQAELAELAAAVASKSQPDQGPYLAPGWSASITQGLNIGGMANAHGVMYRDMSQRRWRMKTCSVQSIFRPNQSLCVDVLAVNQTGPGAAFGLNQTVGQGKDAVCKVVPSPFYDMFAALALGRHKGRGQVGGEPCEIWESSLATSGFPTNISACIGVDGVPRQFNQTSIVARSFTSILTLFNISLGAPPEETFRPSEACRERWPSPACSSTTVQDLTLYRVRSPREPSTLENRNLGDGLGDMAFFCAIGGLDESQVVTSWAVRANTTWGQYAYCLFVKGQNQCFSGTGRLVGRESALGLGVGPDMGQCSPNEDVGSWYSMPLGGHCKEGSDVGQDGCTWTSKQLRTVSARCILEDRGLKAVCAQERGHAPMLRSAAIFTKALESNDPAKGGCPDFQATEIIV